MTELAIHLSKFLREHLRREQHASEHTVYTYSRCFVYLTTFAGAKLGVQPCQLRIEQLTTQVILDFLDNLEKERGNSIRTRNLRLAAIKSFYRYLQFRVPECLDLCLQVHAMPWKRCEQKLIHYLDRDEVAALLDAPDSRTFAGARDRAMLDLAYTAGLRVSELVGLRWKDIARDLQTVRVMGKGRRERTLPLWRHTRSVLRHWLVHRPDTSVDHFFLNARGTGMSRHGFAHRLKLHAEKARRKMPSMVDKRISPHVLRHSCAIHTLEATGDIRKVSLWLGHASFQTTELYLRTDPLAKLEILDSRVPPSIKRGKFKDVPDELLAMLNKIGRE